MTQHQLFRDTPCVVGALAIYKQAQGMSMATKELNDCDNNYIRFMYYFNERRSNMANLI